MELCDGIEPTSTSLQEKASPAKFTEQKGLRNDRRENVISP
jgi:hypothetical protein